MDFDTVVTNLYLNLAKGDLKTPIKDLKFSQQFIEEKVRSGNGTVFPIDIVLFSRHFNIAWLLELKEITTTDLNESQANSYNELTTDSFNQTLLSHTELSSMKMDVTYQGTPENAEHIHTSLDSIKTNFPVVVLDVENCKLYRYENSVDFKNNRLNAAFGSEVKLKIKTMDQLTNYVKFSPKTNHNIVASVAMPTLVRLTIKANRSNPNDDHKYEFAIQEITKECYSTIKLWDKMDGTYRQQLTRSVRDALKQLSDSGLDSLKVIGGERVSISIFDINGNVNQQTLQSITQKIKESVDEVGMSQSSIL